MMPIAPDSGSVKRQKQKAADAVKRLAASVRDLKKTTLGRCSYPGSRSVSLK
jgi:hypothetical protein